MPVITLSEERNISMLSEILEMLGRGMRLKCPCCGYGPLFQSTFQMYDSTFTSWTSLQQLAVWLPVAAAGPILLHRVAKGLWTSIIFFGEGLYLAWPSR